MQENLQLKKIQIWSQENNVDWNRHEEPTYNIEIIKPQAAAEWCRKAVIPTNYRPWPQIWVRRDAFRRTAPIMQGLR